MLTESDAGSTARATMGRLYRRAPPSRLALLDGAASPPPPQGRRPSAPPRPPRPPLGRRARGRAPALPRDGHRARPAGRAVGRHRLEVDADDAVPPPRPPAP